jgi:hypothetical protein
MRDLAPTITRQRLLIEGIYSIYVNREIVESYLLGGQWQRFELM